MKHINLALLLLLISCGGSNQKETPAVNHLVQSTELSAVQAETIYSALQLFPDNTEVSFALIKHGEVIFYGVRREEDTLIQVKNQAAVFEIGSITKVFTATLLSNFVVDGKLDLDDKINNYLDITLNDDIQLSFKELSNHTSGLPRMPSNFLMGSLFNRDNPYKTYDNEKLEEYLTESLELENKPGQVSAYSNLGTGLLGYTLTKLSGKDYQTMLEEMIFSRYDMHNSTTLREEVTESLITGLDANGDETSNWDLSALIAAGGILSTTEDLSKFARAQFDSTNRELNLTRISTYSDSTGNDVGLGWHIIHANSGDTWDWHNGGTGGYRSSLAIDVSKKNAVIILSNISAFNNKSGKVDELCFDLMRTLEE